MSNKTILFADDSATMRHIVENTFAAEPYEVICVASGEGAIAKAKEVRPDLIIVDAGMPGFSGYDVCKAVRNDPSLSETPVLIMSGISNLYDEERGREAGVTEHMKKPFDTGRLIETVADLTTKAPSAEDIPLEEANVEEESLEPVFDESFPEIEPIPLTEESVPFASDAPSFDASVPAQPNASLDFIPVEKQTRDYPFNVSETQEVSEERPIPLDSSDPYGEAAEFGGGESDGLPDLSGSQTPSDSDMPPIEIKPRDEEAGSGSFHVGTLAELAQMDVAGQTLQTEPHENAVELASSSPFAADLESPAQQAFEARAKEEDARLETLSEIPDLPPEAPEIPEAIPDTATPTTPPSPAEVAPVPTDLSPKAKAAEVIRERVDDAAEKIAEKVEGITPAQAEAVQTLTREIIERVVWEVVPDLAEVIIKEELAKLLKE